MAESKSLEALANLLNLISEDPLDIALHAQHIRLAQSLPGMDAEVESAIELFTSFYAAGDDVWLEFIRIKRNSVNLDTADGVNEVLALYERAENDYLSIPLLKSHVEFLLQGYNKYASEEQMKPQELEDLFTPEWMRTSLAEVTKKSTLHIAKSHEVWDLQRDWELEQLENSSGEDKANTLEWLTDILLERLKQLHANSDETFQTYSSFTTNHKPPAEYEKLLIDASKSRSHAVKSFSRRDVMEDTLTKSGYSLDAYANYLAWESRSKYPDLVATSGLFERAIAEAAKRRFDGQADAETYLRSFWASYCDAARTLSDAVETELEVLKRAIRSVPSSGEVWARYIRLIERSSADGVEDTASAIADLYDTAMGAAFSKSPEIEQIIPLVLARAGYEKRRIEAEEGDEETLATLIVAVEGAIELVHKVPAGDQWFRLEKYLSEIYRSAGLMDSVVGVWEAAVKHYKTSYSALTLYTDSLGKADRAEDARNFFIASHRKQFDWPEGVWDAWLAFEHLHGSVDDVNSAIDQIEKSRVQLNAKRARDAAKTQYQYAQVTAEESTTVPVTEAPIPVPQDTPMQVDKEPPVATERGTKRRAEDVEPEAAQKRQKTTEEAVNLKRDRENCTVFVADMSSDVTETDLGDLFKDCGKIREVKITSFQNGSVATVEFMERESVPQGLTKDKKRIHGQEVSVHLAWKSTLYVTNFPEEADDAYVRDLFKKYGTIFDVRWPSKKFKNSRRFCYVQYTSPISAEHALELHNKELQPGLSLSVLVSNPERKKGRTDQDADQREIYVAGLPKLTTSDDLRKLFQEYGSLKDVRVGTDKDGRCRGFAFVEFDTPESASSALKANNIEFKSRRLAVTISDPRAKRTRNAPETGFGQRDDTRNRSVRVKNLPPNTETQEGLLQQALQKIANVKRVEIIGNTCEALVELASAAEAGKLLLSVAPVTFGGNILQVLEETALPGTSSRDSSKFVPRTAASRPRAGLGLKKRVAIGATSSVTPSGQKQQAAVPAATSTSSKGQNDFRNMLK